MFMQIIEYRTRRGEEMEGLVDEWLAATEGRRTVLVETHGRDREDPTHYVDVVEFPSYERAMINNALPETQQFADRMRRLCDGEPRFVNLDVLRRDEG